MDLSNGEDAVNFVKRFQWLDNNRIKVVDKEGIEIIVDVNKKF